MNVQIKPISHYLFARKTRILAETKRDRKTRFLSCFEIQCRNETSWKVSWQKHHKRGYDFCVAGAEKKGEVGGTGGRESYFSSFRRVPASLCHFFIRLWRVLAGLNTLRRVWAGEGRDFAVALYCRCVLYHAVVFHGLIITNVIHPLQDWRSSLQQTIDSK